MTKPIFSEEMYQYDIGNPTKFVYVDQGTFCKASRMIAKGQNTHLLAVNKELLKLFEALKQNGPQFERLKSEIHAHGVHGWSALSHNLYTLCAAWDKGNAKSQSLFTQACVKVENFVLNAFGGPRLQLNSYAPFSLPEFTTIMKEPSLALTESDRQTSKYTMRVLSGPTPPELTEENLHKLECGLMDTLSFTFDQKNYVISYSSGAFRLVIRDTFDDFAFFCESTITRWKKWFDYYRSGKPEQFISAVNVQENHQGRQSTINVRNNYDIAYKWSQPEKTRDFQILNIKPGAEYTLLPASGSTSAPLKFCIGQK